MPPKNKKQTVKTTGPISTLFGGLKPKDDPDKLDKEEFEETEEADDPEDIDKDGENEEEEEDNDESDEETEETENNDEDEDEENNEDECVYKLTKPNKKKKNDMNIELEIEDNFDDEVADEINENNIYVKSSERRTKPYLFEFEKVRLLGDRARQLSLGAKPMIKNIDVMNPKEIAKLELEKKVIPLIILRELPNGKIEKWKVSELNFFN